MTVFALRLCGGGFVAYGHMANHPIAVDWYVVKGMNGIEADLNINSDVSLGTFQHGKHLARLLLPLRGWGRKTQCVSSTSGRHRKSLQRGSLIS